MKMYMDDMDEVSRMSILAPTLFRSKERKAKLVS
jgi:hypothetical protein